MIKAEIHSSRASPSLLSSWNELLGGPDQEGLSLNFGFLGCRFTEVRGDQSLAHTK